MRTTQLLAGTALAVIAMPAAAQENARPSDTANAPITAPSAPVQQASPQGGEAETSAPAPDASSDEIVVTAQRRSESAQRVPISLTVLSAGALEKANISNVQDLQRVTPSFSAYRAPQTANTRLSIRGIGSSGNAAIEPSVGAFVDGIYIARPGPLLAGLNDVSSVEVLRGPQGTLFGRNASVGAINIRTTAPTDEVEGSGALEVGGYGRVRANAILNLPVTPTVATRFSVLFDQFDGYGFNLSDGRRFGHNRTLSARGGLRWDIAPALQWLVRGDYQSQRGDGATTITVDAATVTPSTAANFNTRLNGLIPKLIDTYSYSVRQTSGGRLQDDQWGVSSDLSLGLGDYTLRLLSGFRDWDNRQTERDISLTPADLFGRNAFYRSKTHSEELQVTSPGDRALSFVAGLYYFREDYTIGTITNLNPNYCNILIRNTMAARLAACLAGPQGGATVSRFNQVTESYAAFGQATYKLTPQWDVTLGLRYSHDDKDGTLSSVVPNSAASILNAADAATLRFNGGKVTYRANTTYRPIEDVMLFATVSTGYKSGGFDSGTGSTLGNNRVFQPETTTNYELGYKTQFFDRRLTINNTLFRMDIDQFQLRSYNGTAFSVRNAGSIRQQGAEFEVTGRPMANLTLGVAATRLASEYTEFNNAPARPGLTGVQNLTGRRVSFSPKWQGVVSGDYRHGIGDGLSLALNSRLAFVSDTDVGSAGDGNPQGNQPGYALLGARLSLFGPDDRWELAVSGENLTDRGYCTLKYAQTLGGPLGLNSAGATVQRCVLGEPRLLRASAKLRF